MQEILQGAESFQGGHKPSRGLLPCRASPCSSVKHPTAPAALPFPPPAALICSPPPTAPPSPPLGQQLLLYTHPAWKPSHCQHYRTWILDSLGPKNSQRNRITASWLCSCLPWFLPQRIRTSAGALKEPRQETGRPCNPPPLLCSPRATGIAGVQSPWFSSCTGLAEPELVSGTKPAASHRSLHGCLAS